MRWKLKLAGTALTALVTACGGGGGSSDSTSAPAPTPTPTSTDLTFTGTASRGAALGGKTVDAKCATGAASGTTKTDGTFNLVITRGKWPCLARVTDTDGAVLHTAAAGSGSSTIANITPVTQLIVANLAGTDPAAYYAAFDAPAAVTVTSTTVAASQAAVVATLKAGGIDLTPVGNVVSAAMTAGYATALGDLATALTNSGTTLADLTKSVADTSTTTASGIPPISSGTQTPPPDVALHPAAANCPALHSGPYRMLLPAANALAANQYATIVIDAKAGTITNRDGSVDTAVVNGPCRYLTNNGKNDIVIAPSGVLVGRVTNDSGLTYRLAIGFPDQTHTVAELVGDWNALSLNGNNGLFAGVLIRATVDATGAATATFCGDPTSATWNTTTCTALPAAYGAFTVNSDGGYNAQFGRLFAYRTGGGDMMAVEVDSDGSLTVLTQRRTNGLPTVGAVTTSWNLSLGSQLTSTVAVDANSNTIVSVDSTVGNWVRKQNTVGLNDGHLETFLANNPNPGYNFRAAGSALADDGSTATFREVTHLGLRGMGLSVALVPTAKRFQFSVNQP